MLGNAESYAVRKRKKPIQKIKKPSANEVNKSNPSKRHRERLNGELERLASFLPFPEEVRSRLDKLSVLRLSVGYLKVKRFFKATVKKNGTGSPSGNGTGSPSGNGTGSPSGNGPSMTGGAVHGFPEGDLLLQALNGFVLVVTAEGYVFYSSPTVQDYLGFHQSDVVHQSVFELIHADDRAMFRRQLHFALDPKPFDREQGGDGTQRSCDITRNIVNYDPQLIPPENSSFLERSFVCRFRCLLDNSSGFLALNFQGRLKYLRGLNGTTADGTCNHPKLALFTIVTPVQTPSILEIRSKTLIFQTKHKLDFTPTGIDTRGKIVLGYTELELCMRGSGYQFIHAADMMYCADNHIRMIKTGESGLTVFRLLTKNGEWVWVQSNARLVYKGNRPEFIIALQRALINNEGEEHFRQRRMQLPFNCATGEAVLYETGPSLDVTDFQDNSKSSKVDIRKGLDQKPLNPDSLLGSLLKQDESAYVQEPDPHCSLEKAFLDSYALLNVPGDAWQEKGVSSNANCKEKEEAALMAMANTLEQIACGGGDFGTVLEELDVDASKLKDWERTLLKMTRGDNSDTSLELDDILSNEIFSYVEDSLFTEKDGCYSQQPGCPGSSCSNPEASQGFSNECSSGLIPCKPMVFAGPKRDCRGTTLNDSESQASIAMERQDPVAASLATIGTQRLSHMGTSIPIEQNLLQLQQLQLGDILSKSMEKNAKTILSHNGFGKFDTNMATSFVQATQNPMEFGRTVSQSIYSSTKQNNLAVSHQKQMKSSHPCINGQVYPNQFVQSGLHSGMQATIATHLPSYNVGQTNYNQRIPSIPGNDVAANQMHCNTCKASNSPLTACTQGLAPYQSQNHERVWQPQNQHQQPIPNSVQNEQNGFTSDCYSLPSTQIVPSWNLCSQNTQNPRADCGLLRAENSIYHFQQVPQGDVQPPLPSSCMFNTCPPSHSNDTELATSVQNIIDKPQVQSSPGASSYFPWSPSEPFISTFTYSKENGRIVSPLCQLVPNSTSPVSNLVMHPYRGCNLQTQLSSHPVDNSGTFISPHLVHFSEHN